MSKIHSCPCGTGLALSDCCGRYWIGAAVAPTAEALMRSRYSAYALGKVDYLIETHHPSQRQRGEKLQLQRSLQQTRWVNLHILDASEGLGGDDRAEVEFVAVYRLAHSIGNDFAGLLAGGAARGTARPLVQMHERSRFVREAGRWFYLDGDQLPDYQPQRNQPCWCGSGQAFKQCHG